MLALTSAALVVVVGLVTAPWPGGPSKDTSGDTELVEQLTPLLEEVGVRDRVSAAFIDGDEISYAGFGADQNTEFEIGSVTKTFTGTLFADAVERKELSLDTKLGSILDLGDSPAAGVTLEELALHTSGLAPDNFDAVSTTASMLASENPDWGTEKELLEGARESKLETKGTFVYSNLGFALLGLAIAKNAGVEYSTLLKERILEPRGMDHTTLPLAENDLPENAMTGVTPLRGRPIAPSLIGPYAPSGAIRSNAEDMAKYALAMVNGTGPGMSGITPMIDIEGPDGPTKRSLSWFVRDINDRTITYHNGATAGFMSVLAIDRDSHRAVLIMSNTGSTDVTSVALELLTGGAK